MAKKDQSHSTVFSAAAVCTVPCMIIFEDWADNQKVNRGKSKALQIKQR